MRYENALFSLFSLSSRSDGQRKERMKRAIIRFLCYGTIWLVSVLWQGVVRAQGTEGAYIADSHVAVGRVRQLSVELDNLSFFKDNEYSGKVVKGYSLPGFWLQPKLVYYPLERVKVELGSHLLVYHGANKYPSMAYQDIAQWKGNQYQKGTHILPYFRAQMALSEQVDVVLGNLYGAANHRLIEPLYNPELNLTCDPEMGLQVLYRTRRFDLDAWVNWQSFIFKEDTHQEAFTVGLSGRVKYNDPSALFHFYSPVQALVQHRGGEIDTITTQSVQTLMNGAVGVGVSWQLGYRYLQRIGFEVDMLGYYQQAGALWPLDQGYGVYTRLSADVRDFRLKGAYWQAKDFISLFGNPYFSAASLTDLGATFVHPKLIYLGAEYGRSLGKGFYFLVEVDYFQRLSDQLRGADGAPISASSGSGFSASVCMRINPSFLLKQF